MGFFFIGQLQEATGSGPETVQSDDAARLLSVDQDGWIPSHLPLCGGLLHSQ